MVKKLSELLDMAKGKQKILSVAMANDPVVLKAVEEARKLDIVNPILVGPENEIVDDLKELGFKLENYEILNADVENATVEAVKLVRDGKADFLMKGLIRTGDLMRIVLDKEMNLRTERTLSMVSVFEIPGFDRLLIITDAGMVILPTLEQKVDLIYNALEVARVIGLDNPKVALVSAVETVSEKIPSTMDAAIISKMNDRKQIKGCIIDGPFALDNVVSEEAAKHKGIDSPVAGKADILIMPSLDAGNILYKALGFIMKAKSANTILGAKKPIVLTSRADTDETKLLSIALTTLLVE